MDLEPTESYEHSIRKYKCLYSLDDNNLCFLSFYLTEQRELASLSFDVEAADDYHYQVQADQIGKLCEALSCQNTEADIAMAFSECLKAWTSPIGIASFLKTAGIKYQVFYWY